MAVYSMTGYCSESVSGSGGASAGASDAGFSLTLELRSVNSRFLDLAFRLPDELRSSEPLIREHCAKRIKRGKIDVRVALERTHTQNFSSPNEAVLTELLALQASIQVKMPSAKSLSVADIIRLQASGAERDASRDNHEAQAAQKALAALMAPALDSLMEARAAEGERLKAMLLERIAALRTLSAQAKPLIPELVAQQQARFLERWNAALELAQNKAQGQTNPSAQTTDSVSAQSAQDRALSEATAFAIRIDVAEELDRLGAHLDEMELLLDKGGELGKRLDFMIQELHREANTLGSKSALITLSKISVDMKVLIEQMREQVQNIE